MRIIAATNRDLADAVKNRTFRDDLYYRLNVFPIHVPPLRERPKDIPLLFMAFLSEFNHKMGKSLRDVSRQTMESLLRYRWPGNIRELRNVVEQAVIISDGDILRVPLPDIAPAGSSTVGTRDEAESKHIMEVLQMTGWRIKGNDGAAKILGLKPSTLYNRMKKLGIDLHKKKDHIRT